MDSIVESTLIARVDVSNSYDDALKQQGLIQEEGGRRITVNAGIDPHSKYLSLPLELIEKLGLLGFNLTEPGETDDAPGVVQRVFGPATVQFSGYSQEVLAIAGSAGAPATLGYFSLPDSFEAGA